MQLNVHILLFIVSGLSPVMLGLCILLSHILHSYETYLIYIFENLVLFKMSQNAFFLNKYPARI